MIILKKIIFIFTILFSMWLVAEIVLMASPAILAFLREPKLLVGGQKDSLKIYAIGDSFTYGMGMNAEKVYPQVLEKKLKEKFPEKKIEVYNLGKPSHGLSYVFYTIKELYENKKDINSIFLILGGWNVSDYDFARFDKEHSGKLVDKFKLFLNNFRTFRFIKSYYYFKKLYYPYGKEDYVPPFWAKTNYDFDKYQKIDLDYLDKIATYSRDNKLKIIFLNYPQNPPPRNPYTKIEVNHFMFSTKKITDSDYIIKDRNKDEIAINSIIRFIANKYKLTLIDINQTYKLYTKPLNQLIQEDYYHPSEEGQKIIAQAVFDYLSYFFLTTDK